MSLHYLGIYFHQSADSTQTLNTNGQSGSMRSSRREPAHDSPSGLQNPELRYSLFSGASQDPTGCRAPVWRMDCWLGAAGSLSVRTPWLRLLWRRIKHHQPATLHHQHPEGEVGTGSSHRPRWTTLIRRRLKRSESGPGGGSGDQGGPNGERLLCSPAWNWCSSARLVLQSPSG